MKNLIFSVLFCTGLMAQAEVVIYSDRPASRFAGAIAQLEAQTGEKVVFTESNYKTIVERLALEGKDSKADLVITKDLIYLTDLKQQGLLQSFSETDAVKRVPAFMRGLGNEWVALSFRARTLIYNPGLVGGAELAEIASYKDLADPKWKDSLCLRTGKAAYNEALVSSVIADYGAKEAKAIVQGWLGNTKIAPKQDDNEVIAEVVRGENCQLGIINHYYLAMAKFRENEPLPDQAVGIAFLDQGGKGVHTNGTGIAFLKTSKNPKNAQKFLELLLSDENQLSISAAHFEYPAVEGLLPSTPIKDWGTFKKNPTPWEQLGDLVPQARALIGAVGYQ